MGTALFVMLFVVELGLLLFRIKTQSLQGKITIFVRIGLIIGFILLFSFNILEWSFRYYALALLIVIMGIVGVLSIFIKRMWNGKFKTTQVIVRSLGRTILFFFAAFPAILFPEYKDIDVTGDYDVATITQTFTDINRMETFTDSNEPRKLNVGFWYPEKAADVYPLIIFSHGGISDKTSNKSLYRELASHGYVVGSIDHTYHSLFTKNEDGSILFIDREYMKELNMEDAKTKPQQSYDYYQKWMKLRTEDIQFVIDSIVLGNQNIEGKAVYKLVDPTKVGVSGHSLGGSAALCMGRMRDDIQAVIAIESPFMCDITGVKDSKFVFEEEDYPTPVLHFYSDSSWDYLDEWPQYVQNYRMLSEIGTTRSHVHLSGTGHFSLTDLALTSPLLTKLFNGFPTTSDSEEILNVINKESLQFFDRNLKGDE